MRRRSFLKAALGAVAAIAAPIPAIAAPPAKVFGISKEGYELWRSSTVQGNLDRCTVKVDPLVWADLIGDEEALRKWQRS